MSGFHLSHEINNHRKELERYENFNRDHEYDWRINENAVLTMKPMGNVVIVTYRDIMLANLAQNEKLGNIRKGFSNNGKSKF